MTLVVLVWVEATRCAVGGGWTAAAASATAAGAGRWRIHGRCGEGSFGDGSNGGYELRVC